MSELIAFLILLMLYFLPTFVAIRCKRQQTTAIFLLNLFAGWTFIGWVAAIVWAAIDDRETAPSVRQNEIPQRLPAAAQNQLSVRTKTIRALIIVGLLALLCLLQLPTVMRSFYPSENQTKLRPVEKPQQTSDPHVEMLQDQKTHPEKYVHLFALSWSKNRFGSIMMADFTIQNMLPWSIKDIKVTCIHTAPSGTTIDHNTRVLYEIIDPLEAKKWKEFSMGFIHSQATKSQCSIVDFVVMR